MNPHTHFRSRAHQAMFLALRSAGFDVTSLDRLRKQMAGRREDRIRMCCGKQYPFGNHGNKVMRKLWIQELDALMVRLDLRPPAPAELPKRGTRWRYPTPGAQSNVDEILAVIRDGDGVTRVVLTKGSETIGGVSVQDFLAEARECDDTLASLLD